MKVNTFLQIFACAFICMFTITLQAQDANVPDTGYRKMLEKAVFIIKPALVRIHVISNEFEEGKEIKQEGYGSGIIISDDGYIITNHHVAGKAIYISCTMSNKEEIEADLIGSDALTDIAVIKLRATTTNRKFTPGVFGNSDDVKAGDFVLAMGSPLAYSQSVTMGIVSNTELVMPDYDGGYLSLDGEDVGSAIRWIGHDAAIFPGNSGGPLVNMAGEIIGINEVDLGLSGAIPGNLAKESADKLIKDKKIIRGWFGFSFQKITAIKKDTKGILVTSVMPGSPADKCHIKTGDILTSINGTDIDVRTDEDVPVFNQLLFRLPIGKEIEVKYLQDNKEVITKITPIIRPTIIEKEHYLSTWGMSANTIPEMDLLKNKKVNWGVQVASLQDGGQASTAKPPLTEGDFITSIDSKDCKNIDDLLKITRSAINGKTEPVSVIVEFTRKNEKMLTVVHIGERSKITRGMEKLRPWMPIKVQVLTDDLATSLGLEGRTGVRITRIYPNTDKETSGLKIGDIIVAIDNLQIETSEPEEVDTFNDMIRQYSIGTVVSLKIIRNKKPVNIKIKLSQSPRSPRDMPTYDETICGFSARDITWFDKADNEWNDEQKGAYVEGVEVSTWADLANLQTGDLITEMNGKPVTNLYSLKKVLEEMRINKPESVIIKTLSDNDVKIVLMRLIWPKN